jgi:LETM1 and EF-hand domain-containing protein 1, mitochondrial
VTPEEVAAAAAYLKDTIGKEGIQELISNLSKDRGMFHHDISILFTTAYDIFSVFVPAEGKILVEDIVKLASQTEENNEEEEEEGARR